MPEVIKLGDSEGYKLETFKLPFNRSNRSQVPLWIGAYNLITLKERLQTYRPVQSVHTSTLSTGYDQRPKCSNSTDGLSSPHNATRDQHKNPSPQFYYG